MLNLSLKLNQYNISEQIIQYCSVLGMLPKLWFIGDNTKILRSTTKDKECKTVGPRNQIILNIFNSFISLALKRQWAFNPTLLKKSNHP